LFQKLFACGKVDFGDSLGFDCPPVDGAEKGMRFGLFHRKSAEAADVHLTPASQFFFQNGKELVYNFLAVNLGYPRFCFDFFKKNFLFHSPASLLKYIISSFFSQEGTGKM